MVGEGNLIPSQWDYLGESGINEEDNLVFIPCEYFTASRDRYWKFCFHYVTTTVVGSTNTLTKLCLPAKDSGKERKEYCNICFMIRAEKCILHFNIGCKNFPGRQRETFFISSRVCNIVENRIDLTL